ncbi:MAG: M20/M25/M40 family metallo-hydrolase [Candidatus Heimdallarchaeota archaeon]|nr:MAG: M20/M25/M40 family metallo-hydrolase [Candidatus Heimdallarchaeota archaeon]
MLKVLDYFNDHKQTFLDDLFHFLRIPSISNNKADVEKASLWLKRRLETSVSHLKIVKTSGNPVILAEWEPIASNEKNITKSPTVLIYGHYDVQSPEPLDQWISPPFEPEIRDGRIFARGVGDNKGQLFTHLIAIECLTKFSALGLRVKFLFDGEEEIGSPNLDKALIQEKDFLSDIDLVFVSDGPADPSWKPTLCFGARGIVTAQIYLNSANNDVHSGNFGGIQPNPAIDLMSVLQTIVNDNGTCLIKGFYNDLFTPDEGALKAAEELKRTPEMYQKSLGISYFGGEQDIPLVHRVMFRPTINIRGFQSGNVREHAKTIIPKDAVVELDFRLVPNQKPAQIQDLFLNHLEQLKQKSDRWKAMINRCDMTFEAGFAPIYTPLNLPWTEILAQSITEGFGEEPVRIPLLGGSLPLYNLYQHIKKPMYIIPFGQPDQGNHAPNENLMLEWFEKGVVTSMMLLKNLGSRSI